jgi:hypothetical protein
MLYSDIREFLQSKQRARLPNTFFRIDGFSPYLRVTLLRDEKAFGIEVHHHESGKSVRIVLMMEGMILEKFLISSVREYEAIFNEGNGGFVNRLKRYEKYEPVREAQRKLDDAKTKVALHEEKLELAEMSVDYHVRDLERLEKEHDEKIADYFKALKLSDNVEAVIRAKKRLIKLEHMLALGARDAEYLIRELKTLEEGHLVKISAMLKASRELEEVKARVGYLA